MSSTSLHQSMSIGLIWARVLNVKNAAGHKKYCTLGKVVRASLSLSHGNADVERCFSINKKVVTPDRVSLGQDTVCAVRLVKEAIIIHGDGQVSGIPVTHRMLQLVRSAYSTYKDHMDKKKAENEFKRKAKEQAHEQLIEEERLKLETEKAKLQKTEAKDKFCKLQKQLDQKQTEQSNSLKAAEGLLVDAEKRLSEAIKAGDMCQVSVASGLLEVGRKRVAAANRELTSIADNRKKMKIDDI